MKTIPQLLAEELGCKEEYVNNVVSLLDEGNTIPFIARYRKEAHGAMDDTTLRTLETRLGYLRNLQTRREEVKASIDAQGKLTDELSAAIDRALTLAEVEDLYRPYKQKRRTRATVAKEKGLEPLAQAIFEQQMQMNPPEVLAKDYINPDLGVETIEDALAGASDIIAERISDDAELRKNLRTMMQKRAVCQSRAAKPDEDSVYRLYYAFDQPVAKLQSHQILALNRGEKEGFLKISLDLDSAQAMQLIRRNVVEARNACDGVFDCGCGGQLRPAACAQHGARASHESYRYGKRGGNWQFCAEPAPASDAAAGEGLRHDGARPRLRARLQGRSDRRDGKGSGYRRSSIRRFPSAKSRRQSTASRS